VVIIVRPELSVTISLSGGIPLLLGKLTEIFAIFPLRSSIVDGKKKFVSDEALIETAWKSPGHGKEYTVPKSSVAVKGNAAY